MDKQNENIGKTRTWLAAIDADQYERIDLLQSVNASVEDSVYIYSNKDNKIHLKCKVCAVDKTIPGEHCLELKEIDEFSTELFAQKVLEQHGFQKTKQLMELPEEVKKYMEIVQQLLSAEEMNPDSHDATYELIPEVIKAYGDMGDLSECDYKDLNLVYRMCIGTWQDGIESKKNVIDESHLENKEKYRLKDLLDELGQNAQDGKYTNKGPKGTCFGMFGTGFLSFKGKTDEKSTREFIEMCIDVQKMSDDIEIFARCEKTLKKDLKGLGAATASMILHCLKPYTFPIFNGNMGADNIYVYFKIGIKNKGELKDYIDNARNVKKFRDRYFKIKNYRIFDLAARNLNEEKKMEPADSENPGRLNNLITELDKNLILYGPPGTGKTYNSAIYAVAICDGKSVDELTDHAAVMERYNELKKAGRIEFTTFHQSYGYEEFIEGIKPVIDENEQEIGYTIEPGVFKVFCENTKSAAGTEVDDFHQVKQGWDVPYVFIIDEINRGNISKIFGELITLIESTKRGGLPEAASAILPYSRDEFSVPSNVYILGTMNTADRSIALMDTALRRRFQFIEMMPNSDVLRKIHADKVDDLDVAEVLDTINERIEFLYDREHMIGHAFFTGLKDDPSLRKLQSIFEKSVIPLLQEYFYEDYQKIQFVLGDNVKSDDKFKFIIDEKVVAKNIFKGDVEDIIDLPEKKYSINKEAFKYIDSYKGIL